MLSSLETPAWFIDQLDELFIKYLWNDKPPRLKKDVIINDFEHGGLKMTNLKCYIAAQKINWIKNLLNNRRAFPFKYLSSQLKMSLQDYLKCSVDTALLPNNISHFYKDILGHLFTLKEEPSSIEEIHREFIWNNKFIQVELECVFSNRHTHII